MYPACLVLVLGHARLGAQRWFSIAGIRVSAVRVYKVKPYTGAFQLCGCKKRFDGGIKNLIVPLILSGDTFCSSLAAAGSGHRPSSGADIFYDHGCFRRQAKISGIMILSGLAGFRSSGISCAIISGNGFWSSSTLIWILWAPAIR